MAFAKARLQRMEQLAAADGSALQRLGSVAQAVTLGLQETLMAIREASQLWDNGAGAVIEATPSPTEAPEGSEFSQAQWMAWLAAQAAIVVLSEVPLQTLASLAVTDANGDLVLDPETGEPVRPFSAGMDAGALSVLSSTESVKSVLWRDPILGVAPIEQPEEPA